MKLSLVIPTLDTDPGKKDILARCVGSLSLQVDEVIIVDSKTDSLARKINTGLKKATSDFIIVSNDDVYLKEDSEPLSELCHEGEVHVPVVHGGIDKLFHGHMWCIPRGVLDKVGYYDETCPGPYHIDSDYWVRLIEAGIPIIKNSFVHIMHPEPGRTLKQLNNNTNTTEEWFINKWGRDYLRMVS